MDTDDKIKEKGVIHHMSKYPISKEFFPFSHFTPPISEKFLAMAVPNMKVPKAIYRDAALDVSRHEIASYDGEKIEVFLMSPKSIKEKAPCLVYLHGGGFVLAAAGYHYKNAMRYAKEAGCRVVFVNYRLAPKYQHPVFFEDCYAAFCWAYDNADMLNIDVSKIGIGGDSAGSTLAVGVCMMARDRKHLVQFLFQMLPYPFLDARNNSDSCKKYTDTPMWNSTLSQRIGPMTNVDKSNPDYVYYSPVEAESFEGLPPAYIETAEFDCLHDDGILYAEKLRAAGVAVSLNETKGTMHGFDIVQKAPTTQRAMEARIKFMREKFYRD
ncbi:MAG: alpha/beta hydrolase [Firmicutes bacterium]|nr:alpha/beta hydrolase [Bacillota bacterium]